MKAHHKTTLYFIGNLAIFLFLMVGLFWKNGISGKYCFIWLAALEVFLVFEIAEGLLKGELMHPFWWSLKHFYIKKNPLAYWLSFLMYCVWALIIPYYFFFQKV